MKILMVIVILLFSGCHRVNTVVHCENINIHLEYNSSSESWQNSETCEKQILE